jgi:hypothetical protein
MTTVNRSWLTLISGSCRIKNPPLVIGQDPFRLPLPCFTDPVTGLIFPDLITS